MKDSSKTKQALTEELVSLRRRILELEQSEIERKKSEDKYRILVENIPQKIFTKNRDSVYESANKNYLQDLGITTEELKGNTDYVYYPKELADKYRADDKRIMESGDAEAIEEQYTKGGQTFWVHTTKTPLRDDQGNITGILGIFDDITDRKLADQALQDREERYHSLVDAIGQSNIGLLIMDACYRVRFMNKPMVMAFGDQTGRICYEGVGKANSPCGYCKMDEVIKQGRIVTYQPTVANGKTYDIVAVPFQDSDGAMCKLEVLQDITESKRVERALLESNQRLRRFYESGMLGVIYWNMKGQIIDANDKFLEMVGYNRDELESGKIDWINMTPPEFRYLDDNSVKELKATGVNKTPFEKEYIRKDGTRMPIILAGAMLDEEKFNGIAFVLDITDRKLVENALSLSESKYRNIFESAMEGIYQSSPGGKFITVNPAFAKILGYNTPEELISSITDIASQIYVNPDERSRLVNHLSIIDFVEEFEFQAYRKDGTIIWLLADAKVHRDEKGDIEYLEGRVQDLTQRKRAEDNLKNTLVSLRKAFGTIIQVMISAVEVRDPYTAGHQLRATALARALATEMGLSQDKIEAIRMAGPIHDIGKLSIPAEILSKPTKLTNIEFSLIKVHPEKGYEMLKDVESPWPLAEIVYQHHERMDGSGYPRNLKGDDILMEARIMAVADVVESMASHRPYRPALGLNAALKEIENNKGTLYDADVVDACLRLFREKGFELERA